MSSARRALVIASVGLLIVAAAGFYWVWSAPCELGGCVPLEEVAQMQPEGAKLLDVNGVPFARVAGPNRRVISLDSLPAYVPHAFLAIEDRRFYRHGGIDFRRTVAALLRNLRSGRIEEGGSTITQQLARNLFPGSLPARDRSLRRKVLEARVARQIERSLPKEKILELYLNQIYLGNGAYGVDAAARVYFGKPASQLGLAEAATLAAIPQAPAEVNPIDDPGRTKKRRDLVLDAMLLQGYIDAETARAGRETPMPDVESTNGGSVGPYFVDAVRRELKEIVGEGMYADGLKIYTTFDPRVQRIAETELELQLGSVEDGTFGPYAHPVYARNTDPDGPIEYLQGAVVVIDTETGEVRGLVGGRDYSDSQFDRATQALRQPGSAFKPFIMAVGLDRFGSPLHRIDNSRLALKMANGEIWEPRNLTDDYGESITMREALVRSSNTATVRLSQDVGLDDTIRLAHALGITSEIPELPAIALGAASVRLIELTAAYAAFANGGARVQPHLVRRIVDRQGRVIWNAHLEREQVLDPAVAFVLTSMLEDAIDRGTGVAVRQAGFAGVAAGKTGTTNEGADAWFVGYTPDLAAGVWIGFDYPQPILPGASGEMLAAPVWGRIMKQIEEGQPSPPGWRPARGVVAAKVSYETSSVVSASCPATGRVYTEYFIGKPPLDPKCGAKPAPVDRVAGVSEVDAQQAAPGVAQPPEPSPPSTGDEGSRRRAVPPAPSSAVPSAANSAAPPAPSSALPPAPSSVAPPGPLRLTAPAPAAARRATPESPVEEPGAGPGFPIIGVPAQADTVSQPDSLAVPPPAEGLAPTWPPRR